jgi:hypothetical protein
MQSARAQQASRVIGTSSFARGSVKVPELYQVEKDFATIPEAIMTYLLYEQIAGQELLLLTRHDILNGQDVAYQVIKNLNDIAFEYSSNNIIALPGTLSEIFRQYGLVLEAFIPTSDPNVPNSQDYWANFYIETEDGVPFLTVEFQNIQDNMSVEIEVMSSGNLASSSFGLA